jgi:hypothetical protein
MTIRFPHLISTFAVLFILILTGCQDSLVETPTEAPPVDPEAPMTEQEFKRQMDETGMVILDESDYEQFGVELRSPERTQKMADGEPLPKTRVCTDRSTGSYFYSVCSEVTTENVYNVDYFRVVIDGSITGFFCGCSGGGGPILKAEAILDPIYEPCVCSTLFVSLTSRTVRSDGVVLQNNVTDSGQPSASTNFVAFYPKVDTFSFNHRSSFPQPSDVISVSVAP